MRSSKKRLLIIFLVTVFTLFVAVPRNIPLRFNFKVPSLFGAGEKEISFTREVSLPKINFRIGPLLFVRDLGLKLGLDLAGGSHIVFEADMKDVPMEERGEALEGVRNVIERRVNLFGVSEAAVTTSKVGDTQRVVVELPGVRETERAIELIGKTAQLDFREEEIVGKESGEGGTIYGKDVKSTGFTGADFKKAKAGFDAQSSKPVVFFETKEEGASKFAEISRRLIGKPLYIYLDDEVVSAPVVSEEIKDGKGQISGDFTLEGVKTFASLLNSGALPVGVKIVEQRTVEASLGAESVRLSVFAGLVGLGMVAFFMIFYYGWLGFLATLALVVYGLTTLAIYKLVPVVLTLPGVAGFILSIGMAVDSNILIFERMKEEVKVGKPWTYAMEAGFGRAWDSIRDANIATLLTTFVLFNPLNLEFLHVSGPVRGFAMTLALGIFVSLFTGIFVTRTLLRAFARGKEHA